MNCICSFETDFMSQDPTTKSKTKNNDFLPEAGIEGCGLNTSIGIYANIWLLTS